MATVNEQIRDRSITRRVYLEGLTVREAKKIQRVTDKAGKEILNRIKSDGMPKTVAAQHAQVRAFKKISDEAMNKVVGKLDNDVVNLAIAESKYQADLLKKSIPIIWDTNTPAPTQILGAVRAKPYGGKILKDWYKNAKGKAFSNLKADLSSGYLQGLTTPQLISKLHKSSLAKTRAGTVAMVRTALTHTASVSRDITYIENADIISAVQWLSTLDTRTSEFCIGLDGKVFMLNDGPRPPAHVNCRSTTIPITKSWKQLGLPFKDLKPQQRASMDGQVAARTTYPEWLKKQSLSRQREVLGERGAELFAEGKLNIGKFEPWMTQYARGKGDPDWIWKSKTKGAITPIDITKVKVELPPVVSPTIVKKPVTLAALQKPEDVPDFLYDSMLYHKKKFTAAEYPKVKKGIEDKFKTLNDYRSKDLLSAETRSYYSGQYATLNKKVRSGAQLAADDAHKISRIGDDLAALKDDHVVFRGLQYSKDIRVGDEWIEDGITSWSKDYLRGAQFAGGAAKGEKTLLVVRMPKGLKAIVENAPESEIITLPNVKFKVGKIINKPEVPFFDDVKWPIDRMVILDVVDPKTALKSVTKPLIKVPPKPAPKPPPKPAPAPKPPTTTVQKPLTLENAEQDIQEFIKQNRIAQTNEESVSKFTKLADYRSREGLDANTQRYYGTDYGKLNRSLRTGQPFHKHDAHLHDVYTAVRKDMTPLKEEHLVYRGLSHKGDIKVGDNWIEDGVTSWSANSNTGVRFAHMDAKFNPDKESTLLVVRMPKGVKAIVDNKKELELTTLPDVKFKVAKVIRKPVNALDDGTENYLDAVTGHAMKADRVVILEVVEPKAVVKSAPSSSIKVAPKPVVKPPAPKPPPKPAQTPDIPDWVKNPKSWEKSASNKYLAKMLKGEDDLPRQPAAVKTRALHKRSDDTLPDIDKYLDEAQVSLSATRKKIDAIKDAPDNVAELSALKKELSEASERLKMHIEKVKNTKIARVTSDEVDDFLTKESMEVPKFERLDDYRSTNMLKVRTNDYFGTSSWDLNYYLRRGLPPKGNLKTIVKSVESDVKPLQQSHVVFRGVKDLPDNLKIGDEWIEDGITSWSKHRSIPETYGVSSHKFGTRKDYLVVTRLPENLKAIVDHLADREIVTLPNVRYKIAKIMDAPPGVTKMDKIVFLDVVDPDAVIKAAQLRKKVTDATAKADSLLQKDH